MALVSSSLALVRLVPNPSNFLTLTHNDRLNMPSIAHQATQRRLSYAPKCSTDRFSNMRRADEPLEEETRALQVVMGLLGFIIGPRILGSSIVGMVLGATAGGALVNAGGTTGLWAREIGWQAHQFADRRSLPELARNVGNTASKIAAAASAEFKALAAQPTVSNLKTRFVSLVISGWARMCAWADSTGLSVVLLRRKAQLRQLLEPLLSRLSAWLEDSRE